MNQEVTETDNKSQQGPFSEEELSLVRAEMLAALDIFLQHTKYTITLMSSLLAAGAALLAFSEQPNSDLSSHLRLIIVLSSLGSFAIVVACSRYSLRIVQRYYKLYASNYVYSARLHQSQGVEAHPWIEDLFQHVPNINSPTAVSDFMNHPNEKDPHSWYYYRKVVVSFGWIGAFAFVGTGAYLVAQYLSQLA